MKAIEIEAEEYAEEVVMACENVTKELLLEYAKNDFINGAYSKTVDEMILRAIELDRSPKIKVEGDELTGSIIEEHHSPEEILQQVKQEYL
jgi:hypothetical protein